MLIKKKKTCKALTFAHNSALWCGRLCSQESREDHQSRYLTLPAASRCVSKNLLTSELPLVHPFGLWGPWQFGR